MTSIESATLAQLIGPWQREPLVLDPTVAALVDLACRSDPGFVAGVSLVLVDARGAGRLMAKYAGPGGKVADCDYGEIAPNGKVTASLSGTGTDSNGPIGAGRLRNSGGGGSGSESEAIEQWVSGLAGAGIVKVVVDVADVGPVTATLRNGRFSAWWPVNEPFDPAPGAGPHIPLKEFVVTAYDALGRSVDQFRSP